MKIEVAAQGGLWGTARVLVLSVVLTSCGVENSAPSGGLGAASSGGGAAAPNQSGSAGMVASTTVGSGGLPTGGAAGASSSVAGNATGGVSGAESASGTSSGGNAAGGVSGGGTLGGGGGGTGGAMAGGEVDAWYEAEAPGNEIDNGTERAVCAKTCATVTDQATCCSGGGELRQLLGRGGKNNAGGGVTFKDVTVPTDGVYDVTWWYHCGLYDHWHDSNCGGAPYPAWLSFYDPKANPQPGCRPHLISVNGTQLDGPDHQTPFWQFPCFGGSWEIMHVATTPIRLSAGKNQIRLGAPHIADLDAVDIDAIHVVSAGKGVAPVVPEPRALAGDNGRK